MADTPEHRSATEAAKAEAHNIGEELKAKGEAAAGQARKAAWGYAEQARDEAYARGEAYRDYAADETGKVAAALRKASADLSSGSPQERFVGQIADGVAEAADRVRRMTLDDMARETNAFARRHPAAFLGGAALFGFAAARFLKATAAGDDPDEYAMATPPAPRPAGQAGAAATPPRGPAASAPAGGRIPEPATRPATATRATSPAGTPGASSPPTGSSGNSTASSDRPAGVPESKPL